jgi:hypothetical protein
MLNDKCRLIAISISQVIVLCTVRARLARLPKAGVDLVDESLGQPTTSL